MIPEVGPFTPAGKVLVAEDNAAMRQMLAAMCREWGAEVIECADGWEAVEAFARRQPDWVLMDFAMPGLDGLEATGRILKEFPQARIVIVTQYDSEALRQAAREAGVRACISKEQLHQLADILGEETRCVPVGS